MPKLRSAKKRLRQDSQHRIRNRSALSRMRSAVKAVRQAEDAPAAQAALAKAVSIIDKSARHKIIHPNAAARYKSRLTRQVQALS